MKMAMPEIYVFEKTAESVINMLDQYLSGSEKFSSRQEFITCAELIIESKPWDALWKLSKETCHKLNVRYPFSIDVTVTEVIFKDLTAFVIIDPEINGLIRFPESVSDVPIKNLWVKVNQPHEHINIEDTARLIDMLRFFYDNIWWPWENENECYSWKVIKNRVDLWKDIIGGELPSTINQHVTEIREEAFFTQKMLKDAEVTLSELEANADGDEEEKIPVALIKKLGELNIRLDYLRTSFCIYECPHLRKSYVEELKCENEKKPTKSEIQVVWSGGDYKYLQSIHSKIFDRLMDVNAVIKITDCLVGAIKSESPNIMIFQGTYNVPHLPLPKIRISGFDDVILNCGEPRSFLFNLTKDAELHSLKLITSDVNNMIVVQRRSTLYMRECELNSLKSEAKQSSNTEPQGILVLAGSTLIMEDCSLFNLYTGLCVEKGAKVKLVNCNIEKCGAGIQMFSGAEVIVNNCKFTDCREYAIRYDEIDSNEIPKLSGVPGLTVIKCEFTGNEKFFSSVST